MAGDRGYFGSFQIPSPKGVYQAAGDTNINVDYAYRAENMRTERGLLATAFGTKKDGSKFPPVTYAKTHEDGSTDIEYVAVETLTRFYRRLVPEDPYVYVACGGGEIFTYTEAHPGWARCRVVDEYGNPDTSGTSFISNRWSYVTYETVKDGATVDVLIMSNEEDGMVVLYGTREEQMTVQRRPLRIGDDFSEVRFAALSRHAERIWGTGDPRYPDNVYYSKPYNPFDWEGDEENPEMGGGMIQQPTWDGDAFIALEPFGGYLLAIKPNTIFEIRGTDPSSFTIQEAYGTDGPVQGRTVCVDRLGMYYLSKVGLGVYDGATLQLLSRDALYETMRMRADERNQEEATACVCDHVYYLALCVKESEGDILFYNNIVIEYDTERRTFMIRKGIRVKDFFVIDGKVFYTDADPGMGIMVYNHPGSCGYSDGTEPIESVWETPWLDLGKAYMKRDFELRFTADADEDDTPVEITIITDRREKKRVVLLQKRRKDYRVKIQNAGVRMKLRVRSSKKVSGWRIYGGVQVEYSIDEV
ncbi:MAG: hypothetical protein IJ381_07990 [Clostridia bacterium]|nr:hypothetical protein [Clostridia bacterium]